VWKIVSSSYVLKNDWLTVRSDSCMDPHGRTISPYFVLEYSDWVNIVPLTPKNEVIMIQQYRHALREVLLEIPSGGINKKDASPEECARRELLEETGYSCTDLIPLCKLSPNPATHTNITHCFLALNVEQVQLQMLDETEDISIVKIPLADIRSMLNDNRILQTLHVSALFYALAYLDPL